MSEETPNSAQEAVVELGSASALTQGWNGWGPYDGGVDWPFMSAFHN